MALWFPVAFLHAFIQYAIVCVEVFVTSSPLEVYIELLFYLLFFICCFVVLNLPFYIKKPESRTKYTKYVVIIFSLLSILTLFAIVSIAGFSTRYIALTLSHSQDSDARLLIAVLPTVVAAVVAMRWDHIKKVVRKLDQNSPRTAANDNTNAGSDARVTRTPKPIHKFYNKIKITVWLHLIIVHQGIWSKQTLTDEQVISQLP